LLQEKQVELYIAAFHYDGIVNLICSLLDQDLIKASKRFHLGFGFCLHLQDGTGAYLPKLNAG
jgi:hypothetical protein